MSRVEYLSLGSIVNINEMVKKIMITSRGVVSEVDGQRYFFDYAGCLYPEGLQGENLLFFNHEDIDRVIFNGWDNEMGLDIPDKLNEFIEKNDIVKGNAKELAAIQRNAAKSAE